MFADFKWSDFRSLLYQYSNFERNNYQNAIIKIDFVEKDVRFIDSLDSSPICSNRFVSKNVGVLKKKNLRERIQNLTNNYNLNTKGGSQPSGIERQFVSDYYQKCICSSSELLINIFNLIETVVALVAKETSACGSRYFILKTKILFFHICRLQQTSHDET